jgi:DUF971 family protein
MSKPTAITLNRAAKKLIIVWDDGATCEYALDVLREACPCVECRGGHENMSGKPDVENLLLTIPLIRNKSYAIAKIVPVGNYAITPEWTDGHSTGIYTWGYLRELCAGLEEAVKKKDQSLYKPLGE